MNTHPTTLSDWQHAYREQSADPCTSLAAFLTDASEPPASHDAAWILRCDGTFVTEQIERLATLDRTTHPLWGVPFAVKDNIDVAGLPTTAACPDFAYTPTQHASTVQRLLDAGAILVGKTNLDQFATGLVGTRSPYGAVPNTFNAAFVSGGSSSGSASVVARGLVPFALGTDTAGSGRVPAGLNNIVGLKPTPGSVPMQGVLPACRTLDVVSVFALTVADAALVMSVMEGTDDGPVFQHHTPRAAWLGQLGQPLRVGIPAQPEVDAALGFDAGWAEAVAQLQQLATPEAPIELVPTDMQALFDVARLLYEGPWVAERHTVLQGLMARQPEAIDPVVRAVVAQASQHDATSAFRARYALETLRLQADRLWEGIDVLVVPTAPTCPTLAAVAAEPVLRNSELGRYTNFVNLLGMAALAVPSSVGDGTSARPLPFGVTFIGPGGSDAALAALGLRWQAARHAEGLPLGATGHRCLASAGATPVALPSPPSLPAAAPTLSLAVVGAHLQGMPLHGQLVERGCRLLARTHTAAAYRLYALPGTVPPKPGLARVGSASGEVGVSIEVEVYEMPLHAVGSFLALIPSPLGLGTVELADGRWVKGFICEPAGLVGAQDISHHGGWRAYIAERVRPPQTPQAPA
jgi:allophanate hydrolase